ncbi:MAG: hypothetical protein ACREDC_00645 [Bradyrhizobium sp.]
MGKTSHKIACAAVLALTIGAAGGVQPASAQSLTDRIKSLFGVTPHQQPAESAPSPAANGPQTNLTCPEVQIRSGAATYAVAPHGEQPTSTNVMFQATINKTARECLLNDGQITVHLGIQGRVIVGPSGAPPNVEIPLRIAVVQGGIAEKVITTKAYVTDVAIQGDDSVPFSFVADDLVYPAPPSAAIGDSYIFYVGFDPLALGHQPKPRMAKSKRR